MDSDMSVLNQFFILRISGVSYLDRDYRSPLISQTFECTRRTFGSFDSFATTKTLFIYNHVTLFLILLVKVEFLKKCLHGQTKPKIILIWSQLHIVLAWFFFGRRYSVNKLSVTDIGRLKFCATTPLCAPPQCRHLYKPNKLRYVRKNYRMRASRCCSLRNQAKTYLCANTKAQNYL